MTIAHISSDPYVTPPAGETDVISRSITAAAGDIIYSSVTWRKAGGAMTAMSWNGQTLAKIGTTLDDGEAFTEAYWVQASASATANLTATLAGGQHYTIVTNVGRPPAATTVSLGGLQEQIYNSGTYADPSLTVTGVPAGALTVSALKYMGWDTGYGALSVTLNCDSPFSSGDGDTNTNYRGVWALFLARDSASAGSVVAEWSRSNADQPMYAHRAFYFSTGAVASIDSVTTDGNPGFVVGRPFTYTETGLGTVTGFTVTTAATPAATTDAINLAAGAGELKSWVDGEYYPFIGTVAAEADDGTLTGAGNFPLALPAATLSVTFASVETTDDTYIGTKLDDLGHPLADGDKGYYPVGNGLAISPNSGVSCLGAMTFVLWVHKVSGIMERYDVVINDAGEITDVTGITSRGITSRGITSRHISKRGLS